MFRRQGRAAHNHIPSDLKEVAGLLGLLLGHVLSLLFEGEEGREGEREEGKEVSAMY